MAGIQLDVVQVSCYVTNIVSGNLAKCHSVLVRPNHQLFITLDGSTNKHTAVKSEKYTKAQKNN